MGLDAVDLQGWSLTDEATQLRKWQFPSTNLNVGQYLVAFASNKDRRVSGNPLHTNFRLSASGEYLALVEPDGKTIAISGYRETLLWASDGSALQGRLVGAAEKILYLVYSADGKLLVADGDGPARILIRQ